MPDFFRGTVNRNLVITVRRENSLRRHTEAELSRRLRKIIERRSVSPGAERFPAENITDLQPENLPRGDSNAEKLFK